MAMVSCKVTYFHRTCFSFLLCLELFRLLLLSLLIQAPTQLLVAFLNSRNFVLGGFATSLLLLRLCFTNFRCQLIDILQSMSAISKR